MLDVCGDKMHYTDQWTSQIKELKFKSMTFLFVCEGFLIISWRNSALSELFYIFV